MVFYGQRIFFIAYSSVMRCSENMQSGIAAIRIASREFVFVSACPCSWISGQRTRGFLHPAKL